MDINKTIIEKFYMAFQHLDVHGMNQGYSEQVIYSNPIVGLLHNDEVRDMWKIFFNNAKNISIHFSEIELLDQEYATCKWHIEYTFSKSARKIAVQAKSFMRLREGRIIEHSDAFRLSTWIGQAYGWKGFLFGWTGFMKRRIQLKFRKSLLRYNQEKKKE